MDIIDIRSCIFKHIYNIQDLLNICIIDKLGINMASSKYFWIQQFMKYKLPITNKIYNQYYKWVQDFLYCKYSMMNSTNFINKIKHKYYHYPLRINNIYLYKFSEILTRFNCVNLNKKDVKHDKNTKIEYMSILKCTTHKYNFSFHIDVDNNIEISNFFEFRINKQQLKNILYILYKKKLVQLHKHNIIHPE